MGGQSILIVLVLGGCLYHVSGLECYACENQEGNRDKCVKTTKQCLEHEDTCLNHVGWKLPPYWTPYGDRMHFVSKRCSTATQCGLEKLAMSPHCKRDWYDDWACVECCAGDLCNYYVTLGADSMRVSYWMWPLCMAVIILGRWILE